MFNHRDFFDTFLGYVDFLAFFKHDTPKTTKPPQGGLGTSKHDAQAI